MKNKKELRFELIYDQNNFATYVDKETGVNYLLSACDGLTPLLDSNGNPIISK